MTLVVKKVNSIVDLQYFEVSNIFLFLFIKSLSLSLSQVSFFHKLAEFILRLIITKNNYRSSQLNSKSFLSKHNYLFTENQTLNYSPTNLLSTKRLNSNLINNFVEKITVPH